MIACTADFVLDQIRDPVEPPDGASEHLVENIVPFGIGTQNLRKDGRGQDDVEAFFAQPQLADCLDGGDVRGGRLGDPWQGAIQHIAQTAPPGNGQKPANRLDGSRVPEIRRIRVNPRHTKEFTSWNIAPSAARACRCRACASARCRSAATPTRRLPPPCSARCRDAGINFFDCADVYAGGRSEEILGRLIAGEPRRGGDHDARSTSRWAPDVNQRGLSRRHIMQAVEGSLRRLGDRPHRPLLRPPLRRADADGGDAARAGRPGAAGQDRSTPASATGPRGRSRRRWASQRCRTWRASSASSRCTTWSSARPRWRSCRWRCRSSWGSSPTARWAAAC